MIAAAVYNCQALNEPAEFDRVYNLISIQRQKHVDEAHNRTLKVQRLGTSYLLEGLLAKNGFFKPYIYNISDQGKPLLTKPQGIHFSLSHTDNLAVAVISDSVCGIDVEGVKGYKQAIAKRFFTENDIALLEAEEPDKQAKLFTEIWTFKEAVCKMLDKPLYQVMQEIDFDRTGDRNSDIVFTSQGFDLTDYFVTICHESLDSQIEIEYCK